MHNQTNKKNLNKVNSDHSPLQLCEYCTMKKQSSKLRGTDRQRDSKMEIMHYWNWSVWLMSYNTARLI